MTDDELELYLKSPEVHEAVNVVWEMMFQRFKRDEGQAYYDLEFQEMKKDLISFFCCYDRSRTLQVEDLKKRLEEALTHVSPKYLQ